MRLKILADENVQYEIVKLLRQNNFDVISVSDRHKSLPDKQIIDLAIKAKAILLTEDSDFGEWVFAHKRKTLGVIFLRYKFYEYADIAKTLILLLHNYEIRLYNKFVVISKNKIRIRRV